jgi:hypothetical protein
MNLQFGRVAHPSSGYIQLDPVPLSSNQFCQYNIETGIYLLVIKIMEK